MSRPLEVIILAAGKGTRMRSTLPKVLHPIAARPMLAHVIDTARELGATRIHVVYGHGGELVREAIDAGDIHWVEQAEQLGTGHAVDQAMPGVSDDSLALVLYGDVPLIGAETLRPLINHSGEGIALLSVRLDDPTGYGRIVRDAEGRVERIVEQKDASSDELAIDEGNTGILAAPAASLRRWLAALDNDNAQGEYYLTDVIALCRGEGGAVEGLVCADEEEVSGVNDRLQLARLERAYQRRAAERLMREGVTLADPARFDLRGELICGSDCSIDIGVIIEGRVELGDKVHIGAHSVLRNVTLGDGCTVQPMTLLEGVEAGERCNFGPYARVRPGSRFDGETHVGNFVEVKNSHIARGSKMGHLSYIGDTEMGARVNIGAGTITCNYDGANKHRTVIGDDAFIGSASQLVAPVSIGDGATIGAGSTISRDAPAGALTLSRVKQSSVENWKRPQKKKP